MAGRCLVAQVHHLLGAQVAHHQAGHPVVIEHHQLHQVLQVPHPVAVGIVIHRALHQVAVDIVLRIVFR